MAKVSIITPVYNALPYLHECIKSIKAQSFTDWELVCVDDCSTDLSYTELLRYAEDDKRIKVLQMPENSGSGPARNTALDNAIGDYILFMDPDDLYPNNKVIESLYNSITTEDIDASCGNINLFRDEEVLEHTNLIKKPFIGKFKNYGSTGGYYRFMFKKQLIENNNIRFPNYRRRQDPVFLVDYMINADNIAYINEYVYKYRVDHKSINWTEEKVKSVIDSFYDNIKNLTNAKHKEVAQHEYNDFIRYCTYEFMPHYLLKANLIKAFKLLKHKAKLESITGDINTKSNIGVIIKSVFHFIKQLLKKVPFLGKILLGVKKCIKK